MRLSPEGTAVIHYFERCRLKAYPDPESVTGTPWTIGWGHTGPEVYEGVVWTQEQADDAFRRDVGLFEEGVVSLVDRPLTQGQFDALVSFAFSVGLTALKTSTLLRRINRGDPRAVDEFSRWIHNNGRVMLGLKRRRAAEAALFDGATAAQALAIAKKLV